jgi:hypothetical protein
MSKPKRPSFTAKDIIDAFVAVTGLPHSCFSAEVGEDEDEQLSCRVVIEDALAGNMILDGVWVYRDQIALDKCMEDSLPYDETYGFFDVGQLTDEEIIRHAAKGCDLSELRHWIIAQGREDGLSDEQIVANLKKPLDTVIDHYKEECDEEGALSTFFTQCRGDQEKMAKHVLKAAGGSQKVWTKDFFHELPGGFIVHIIPDEETEVFRKLMEAADKARK